MSEILTEKLEIHDSLNPLIWDGHPETLKDEVRDRIFDIVECFKEYIEIPIEIADIHILGSNASYNYTDTSDLDVHLVVNFDLMDASQVILQTMFDAERKAFNDTYDISIHGINVELYVEDIKSSTVSNGIYSVVENDWIKQPTKPSDDIPDIDVTEEVAELSGEIQKVLLSSNTSDVKDMINRLYMIRKRALLQPLGEYSEGNLVFKEIRSLGLLDELKERLNELISRDLTLEKLRRKRDTKR